MTKVYQRAGRAGRDGTPGATFLLICESKLIGDRTIKSGPRKKNGDNVEIQQKLTGSERRGNLNAGLWELINTPGGGCIRDIGLKQFNAIDQAKSNRPHNDRCCSNCHKHLAISTDRLAKLVLEEHVWKNRVPWLKQTFTDWRRCKALEVLPVWLQSQPGYFMLDSELDALSVKAYKVTSEADLRRVIKNGWADIHEYALEILDILQRCRNMPFRRGFAVHDAWSAGLGKKSATESVRNRKIDTDKGSENNRMTDSQTLVEPETSRMSAEVLATDS